MIEMGLAVTAALVMSTFALIVSLRLLWLNSKSREEPREPECDAALRSRVGEYMQRKYHADMDEVHTATGETLDAWAWHCRLRRKRT